MYLIVLNSMEEDLIDLILIFELNSIKLPFLLGLLFILSAALVVVIKALFYTRIIINFVIRMIDNQLAFIYAS